MYWRRGADPLLIGAGVVHPGQRVKSLPHTTANQCIWNRLISSCHLLPCVDNVVENVGP